MTGFDTIIVGAGSAGCVLANRLSAQSAHSVLLIEAGRDTAPGQEPADVLDTFASSYYNKSYCGRRDGTLAAARHIAWDRFRPSPDYGRRIVGDGDGGVAWYARRLR